MTHQHFDTSQTFGFLGGFLGAIFKPLFIAEIGFGLSQTIMNVLVGSILSYILAKKLPILEKYIMAKKFSFSLKNIFRHAKSSFVGVGIIVVALFLVWSGKATLTEASVFLLPALGAFGFAPKNTIPMLILAMFAGACSPRQRMDRLLRRHPELIAVQDTITYKDTITLKGVISDTVFGLKTLRTKDTIIVKHDRLTQRFYYTNDTVRLWGECAPDTVFITKNIPVNRVAAPLPRDRLSWGGLAIHWKILIIILSAIIILSFLIDIIRKIKSKILL